MRSKKILMIDCETVLSVTLSGILSKEGFDTIVKSSPLSINLLSEMMPKIILVNLEKSKEDGLSICREIRINEKTQSIPIILLSNFNDKEIRLEFLKNGATDYILKPFDNEELIIKIKNQIDATQFKIAEQKINRHNERLESLWRISQFKTDNTRDLLDYALHEAILLTKSKIGFIFFYNEHKKQFTLNTWSHAAMKECNVIHPETVYELNQTGCWGEAVRQRQPYMNNNYGLDKVHEKGLPEGHVKLDKFLTIPVFIEDSIVAVAGVANKEEDYDLMDIQQLTLLMDKVWEILEKFRYQQELIAAKEKAEESDRLKTAFLHNISDEIRNPLNAIIGFSDAVANTELSSEKKKKYSSMIKTSSNQLLTFITDIINIATIEARREKLQENEVDIKNLMQTIFNLYHEVIEAKNISFTVTSNIPEDKNITITDEAKLTMVLTNLINNSIKFTTKGQIKVLCKLNESYMEFSVEDTGVGISSNLHKKIFEIFNQSVNEILKPHNGVGLGLAIAKSYVNLMGGRIWVSSEPGVGSAFHFTLPHKPILKFAGEATKKDMHKLTPTILVAEDDVFNLYVIQDCLMALNCEIIHVDNGLQAVEICRKNPSVSLILMDVRMPLLNGFDATKKIKEFRPDVPIIIQTAYVYLNKKDKDLLAFADDYIEKPINRRNLIEMIKKHLNTV
jgi:signal transduction histidine kinase/DNA-binding response OmpR family regulator